MRSPAEAFPYRVTVAYSTKDGCYVARVPVLPHCAAHGESAEAAVREALAAAESVLQVMRDNGDVLPPPEWVRASGQRGNDSGAARSGRVDPQDLLAYEQEVARGD